MRTLSQRLATARFHVVFVNEDIDAARNKHQTHTKNYLKRRRELQVKLNDAESIVFDLEREMTGDERALVHYRWSEV